jgi:hypothetical protein
MLGYAATRLTHELRHPAPVMRRAASFHAPLDRRPLLLYISPERLTIQPPALTHLTETDILGNLVKRTWPNQLQYVCA